MRLDFDNYYILLSYSSEPSGFYDTDTFLLLYLQSYLSELNTQSIISENFRFMSAPVLLDVLLPLSYRTPSFPSDIAS